MIYITSRIGIMTSHTNKIHSTPNKILNISISLSRVSNYITPYFRVYLGLDRLVSFLIGFGQSTLT